MSVGLNPSGAARNLSTGAIPQRSTPDFIARLFNIFAFMFLLSFRTIVSPYGVVILLHLFGFASALEKRR
jgi:hypothetical protein